VSDQEIRERLRAFIVENFYLTDPAQLVDDGSLIESGIVDSTGILDVILFIEGEYGIEVGDREATPENLDSIARIAAFVTHKRDLVAEQAPAR
jgi:acyl carrier protein